MLKSIFPSWQRDSPVYAEEHLPLNREIHQKLLQMQFQKPKHSRFCDKTTRNFLCTTVHSHYIAMLHCCLLHFMFNNKTYIHMCCCASTRSQQTTTKQITFKICTVVHFFLFCSLLSCCVFSSISVFYTAVSSTLHCYAISLHWKHFSSRCCMLSSALTFTLLCENSSLVHWCVLSFFTMEKLFFTLLRGLQFLVQPTQKHYIYNYKNTCIRFLVPYSHG